MTLRIVKIVKSNRKNKRYKAVFNDGTETHFGDNRYENYTIHHDDRRKENYINRHINDDLTNPKSPGALSMFILWNKKTLSDSIKDYKKRFGM